MNLTTKIKRLIALLFMSAIILGSVSASSAQNNPLQTLYSYRTDKIAWSSDSQIFVFHGGISASAPKITVSDMSWYSYSTVVNTIATGNTWPLLPVLTPNELQTFQPLPDSLMFSSPNSRYLIYAIPGGDDPAIALADRQAGQSISTGLFAGLYSFGTEVFNVTWSANSQAFVTATTAYYRSEPTFFNYVSNYSTNLSNLSVQELGFLRINNQDFGTREVYDLSSDGRFLLVEGYNAANGESRLIIWDALNPTAPVSLNGLTETNVKAASYKPGDESKILVLNQNGLIEYNLLTNAITTIRTDINSAFAIRARFSPDGQWLALMQELALYVLSLPGNIPPTPTPTPTPSPTPPPAANTIVFQTNRDGNDEIYVMNNDGSSPVRRTTNTTSDTNPVWKPDRSKIAFSSNRDGNYELYWMNADGTGQTRLTTATGNDGNPAWSPDGTRIAFVSERDGNKEIYLYDATTGVQTRLTNNTAEEDQPDWSPDGTKIAFSSTRDGTMPSFTP